MYSVDDRDEVEELRDFPQSSVGAPLPAVVADERRLFLAYLVEAVDTAWDGRTVRVVTPDAIDAIVATVEFAHPRAHLFGPPNDEAFDGHPLAARGVHPYGAFEVRYSSWVRHLERMNAVHPAHTPARFARLRHYIFAFHDSTFECVAEGIAIEVRGGSMAAAVREMVGRLHAPAS
jgi:hypothetical protein